MIIAVTGTPGTGKTSVSAELSRITGLLPVSLNDLAQEKNLYEGRDRKRGCMVVDIKGLQKEVAKMQRDAVSAIVESHFAHDMPADAVVVLRANPGKIRERGLAKGWSREKAEENAQAEIMEVCRSEALSNFREIMELDTTAKTPRKAAEEIALMMEKRGLFVSRDMRIEEGVREKLREPYGKLFEGFGKALSYASGGPVYAVGDRVCRDMLSSGSVPDIAVVDGRISRQPVKDDLPLKARTIRARNPAGSISPGIWKAVNAALRSKKPVKIEVSGEEDIAVLPLMQLSGDGASIVYGLFGKGVCVIKTDEKSRKTAMKILSEIASGN